MGDQSVREILVHTSERPRSARELAAACDVSKPTVYRRLEALERRDLLAQKTRYDADGNHYAAYACRLEEVTFGVDADGLAADLERGRPVAADD
ncbi:ArsR family transcriptional regulator [Halogeometricum pallidum JCM 14848]|uniref:ArsR family transcriptional regulator n=1 Tax=Halogeometricum pallidum JCM 14848 TaxID=1227487 RepID=M0DMB8_HALPD|nr:ArsR family transcriptional regulator [Halogeometricum pallidum JCM 14848]